MPSSPIRQACANTVGTIIRQMPVVPDDEPLGLADQLRQPPLAFDQQHVAQIGAVKFDQVEGEQDRLLATLLAPQRMEVRRAVRAEDHSLAVDQERMRFDAKRGVNDGGEAADNCTLKYLPRGMPDIGPAHLGRGFGAMDCPSLGYSARALLA